MSAAAAPEAELVSVIIPTHNRAQFLAPAVRSVLEQTYRNREVIVIDDGSTDATAEVMAEFPDVIFRRKAQGGPASARNAGLREARGSIIALLDSDDVWDPSHVETCVDALKRFGAGFVFSSFRSYTTAGALIYENYYRDLRPHLQPYLTGEREGWHFLDPGQARAVFLARSEAPSSATVLRREVMEKGWDERAFGTEDHLLLVDAVMAHRCGVAFSLVPTWTKRVGTANIFDQGTDRARISRMDVLVRKVIFERWGAELRPEEVRLLRRDIALHYADWAYSEAAGGRFFAALRRYAQSIASDAAVLPRRWLARFSSPRASSRRA